MTLLLRCVSAGMVFIFTKKPFCSAIPTPHLHSQFYLQMVRLILRPMAFGWFGDPSGLRLHKYVLDWGHTCSLVLNLPENISSFEPLLLSGYFRFPPLSYVFSQRGAMLFHSDVTILHWYPPWLELSDQKSYQWKNLGYQSISRTCLESWIAISSSQIILELFS